MRSSVLAASAPKCTLAGDASPSCELIDYGLTYFGDAARGRGRSPGGAGNIMPGPGLSRLVLKLMPVPCFRAGRGVGETA